MLDAIKFWLQKHPEDLNRRFTDNFILESIEFILQIKTFYFNGEHYRQQKGTAMGTKFAHVYVTLVIGYLEETLYRKVSNEFGQQFGEYLMKFWNRFLDDYFVPWTPSLNNFNLPHYFLNSLQGAQWLSGRVLDSRPKGRGFEPHRRHCVVVLEQDTFILA